MCPHCVALFYVYFFSVAVDKCSVRSFAHSLDNLCGLTHTHSTCCFTWMKLELWHENYSCVTFVCLFTNFLGCFSALTWMDCCIGFLLFLLQFIELRRYWIREAWGFHWTFAQWTLNAFNNSMIILTMSSSSPSLVSRLSSALFFIFLLIFLLFLYECPTNLKCHEAHPITNENRF